MVTGAASGLGKAIAKYLASKGYHVIATDKDFEALTEIKAESISIFKLDTTHNSSIQEAFLNIGQKINYLDGLVNNAGMFDQIPMVEGKMERFEDIVNVNVLGAFRVTHTFFPLLLKSKGRIINISSETAKTLLPFQTYGTTKYMMEAWSNTLRMELKLLKMHVSLIRPGGHQTPLLDRTEEVLNNIPKDSLFVKALNNVRLNGVKMVRRIKNDPEDVARKVYKALVDKNPKRIYRVNESNIYRFLTMIPGSLKETLVLYGLKKSQNQVRI